MLRDGHVTMHDAALVLRFRFFKHEIKAILKNKLFLKKKAEVTGDGKIDMADVVAIAKKHWDYEKLILILLISLFYTCDSASRS